MIIAVNSALYFAKGPASKDIRRDMTNTTANLRDELESDKFMWGLWNMTVAQFPNVTSERELALQDYIWYCNYMYNEALRGWFNSSDKAFTYYWFTQILLNSVTDVSAQNLTIYRGQPPYKPTLTSPYVKRYNYTVGDVIFSNQPEFFTMNKNFSYGYAKVNDIGRVAYYGTVFIVGAKSVLDTIQIDTKIGEHEMILPPGKHYRVIKANKADILEKPDEYYLDELK